MINNNIDINQPIILGLAGKAATGKTSVAEFIVPKAQINVSYNDIVWDHIFFALPLYELASIKKKVKGVRQKDRQMYSIHEVLYDLYGGSPIGNVPPYDELINLTHQIYDLPIEDDDVKPRSFLQKAGDLCRAVDEDCFARWAITKSNKMFRSYVDKHFYDGHNPFCVIVSDVRFLNEAEWILKQQNGIVVCFDADDSVRNERMMKRDGSVMTDMQKMHRSENEVELVKQISSVVIDTNEFSVEEQAKETIFQINKYIDIYAQD